MKKLFTLSTTVVLISLLVFSCKKDDTSNSDEYSSVVADEIAASSKSVTSEAASSSSNSYKDYNQQNSLMKSGGLDTVFHKQKTFAKSSGSLDPDTYSFSYSLDFGVVLNSTTKIVDNVFYNSNATGSFDNSVVKASVTEKSKWVLTGFSADSSCFAINGTGVLKANSVHKVKEDTIVATSNIEFNNFRINKTTDEIAGGTLNWNISGTINGKSFSYNAVLKLTSNARAELTLSDNKYYINISTGKVEN